MNTFARSSAVSRCADPDCSVSASASEPEIVSTIDVVSMKLEGVRLEGRQDLLGEVVEDVAVRTAERGDELLTVLGGPHRQVGEIQPGGPPVGPLVERGHALGRQPETERRVHQRGRLLGRELQVGRPELRQLLGGPKPGDRQRRIGARRDGELHGRRGRARSGA